MAKKIAVTKGERVRFDRAVGVENFAVRVLTDHVIKESPTTMPRRKVLRRFSPPVKLEDAFESLGSGAYLVQLVGASGMSIASVKVRVS